MRGGGTLFLQIDARLEINEERMRGVLLEILEMSITVSPLGVLGYSAVIINHIYHYISC